MYIPLNANYTGIKMKNLIFFFPFTMLHLSPLMNQCCYIISSQSPYLSDFLRF